MTKGIRMPFASVKTVSILLNRTLLNDTKQQPPSSEKLREQSLRGYCNIVLCHLLLDFIKPKVDPQEISCTYCHLFYVNIFGI